MGKKAEDRFDRIKNSPPNSVNSVIPSKISPMKISAVCFDLGKVLLHFDWAIMLERVAKKSPLPPQEIGRLLKEDPQIFVYETGGTTSAKFFRI